SATDILKYVDIVNIDVAVMKEGWYGDSSRMDLVGEVSPLARRLVETNYEATRAGIHAVSPGATLVENGYYIQIVDHREV
ncbi:M24 family metallopeptidase, partial [Pseudomonas syringae group genomosp. 7]